MHLYAQTPKTPTKDSTLHYPLQDRRGDRFTWRNTNPFDLSDTSFIKQNIEYDPKTNQYYIIEKIGNIVYRKPTYLTFDEFWQLQSRQQEADYFNMRSQTLFDLNRKTVRPKPRMYDKLFDRIFGVGPNGLKVEIKPEGTVDLTAGYQGQNVKNPTLPENARKNGGFDFNMDANVSVVGNIGDKLKLPINYNTLANFDYENQLKLDYKGMDDEIIKSVEAGNLSFETKGTLITGVQSLFGVKTQLQFGKFFITTALATQRSERQTLALQGGGLSQQIKKTLDDYEENKHFLLAQYFKNNYNTAMKDLPVVNSQVQILRMEVWVTNRTGSTTETRAVVGLMDLAEPKPFNPNINSLSVSNLPENGANDLYSFLASDAVSNRNPALINNILVNKGLTPVNDFEKTFARKLDPSEYYFNPQVGFLSLSQQLQPDDVLAVAYQYTYNGRVYQVGEFSQDVTVDSTQGVQKVLFLKLLKATSQRVSLPIWGLMMKNVYSLDVTGLQPDDFKLNVVYQDPSAGIKRYLPEAAPDFLGKTLISILNADRLNNHNDPLPDGLYDFVDSFTVLSQQGKIIFPVLEPFGKDLDTAFHGLATSIRDQYVYHQLYDSIKAIAQTYANLNRFLITGTIKGSSSTDIYLGGFNIPPGSVTVTAGGQVLQENTDYVIDYNLGTLKIINSAIINSGVPVSVSYENNASFGIQQRSFLGMRLDYLVNKKLSLGATLERLSERPYFTKMNYGEDPIRNTMYGVDFNYQSELPSLTRLLNKLPFYNTNVTSTINAYGEAAVLKPGHPPQIGKGNEGLIYIDDFEGSTSSIDLRFPFISWTLSSTPSRFHESTLSDNLAYGENRAKLAWYNIEPILQDKNSPSNPLRNNLAELSDPRVRAVYTNELFPQRTTNITDVLTSTFDLAYYPTEPGPYNYTAHSDSIDANGKLKNPISRWGGIMRSIDQTDFETGNIEFMEFWVQDPFIKNPASSGGKLYINLGNISEDVLKDGRRFYENGLNTPTQPAAVDNSGIWGKTPVNPIQITQAFSNDPNDRTYQDVGFDGLDDDSERIKRTSYLNDLGTIFGTSSRIYQNANLDPSNDDYKWYRDPSYDAASTGILGRYKNYNNPQGNSPVSTGNSEFSPAATLYPDNEDLNRDNTLNESEEYYEYEINLLPGMDVNNTKYITDKRIITPKLADGSVTHENWYLFRIPIKDFTNKVGNIPDFKSIRFIRMYMTGFEDSIVMRFASLNLVRNQWRTFTFELDTTGSYTQIPPNSRTNINVTAVNIEENSSRSPIPYVIPPGIERVQLLSNNGVNLLQNEQSMSMKITNLDTGHARAVFKTLNLDLRQYGQLSMFIHAEAINDPTTLHDGDLNAVIRIGQDFLNNYYEIKIPLKVTPFGSTTADAIWPAENNLDFILNDLIQLKVKRNGTAGASLNKIYRETVGNKIYSVLGNPNLAEVQGFLIGIENANKTSALPLNTEVWVDELRLSKLDENGGWAALGRVDMQLADLGTLSVSANTYTQGFGTIEQGVNERAKNNMFQFDAALNIDAGKLLPRKVGLTIPVYASINKTILTPQYDPYDQDILYKDKLNTANINRDSVKKAALDQTTIKTINFTNVRFAQTGTKARIWSPSNFDFSYSYTKFEQTNSLITNNSVTKQRLGIGYTYNGTAKYIEPFKNTFRSKTPWLSPIKDINLNPIPSLIGFRADINKQFGMYVPRIVNTFDNKVERVDTSYDKYFTFDRYYNFRWDFTHSLNLDFSAINFARVDEPFGILDTKAKKDTVRRNFFTGGRNTLYQQKATLSYNFPLAKLPLTDWITAHYTYATTYNWIGASLLAYNLGNTIENSQQNNFNTEFDFTRLYSKSKFLTAVNTPPPSADDGTTVTVTTPSGDSTYTIPPRADVIKDLKGNDKRHALQKWRKLKRDARAAARKNKTTPDHINPVLKTAGQVITMVKHVSIDYSETYNSRVPGYKDSTKFLGQNFKSMQPGFDYVFGRQPDTTWLNKKAAEGAITRDTLFNLLYQQDFEQRYTITAQLEPIREFTIDVNLQKTFTKQFSELFKVVDNSNKFNHLSPLANGGFNVSYISFKTLFSKYKPTEVSQLFTKFQDNRIIIANKLAQSNPYWKSLPLTEQFTSDGFPTGYGRYAQDVLIPSFISAYTGKDPNGAALIKQSNPGIKSNPFSGIKALPNWRVTFTGLTKIPALANAFSNITLTHGYSASLSMNSFTSALLFQDPFHYGVPYFRDTISGNYIPFFLVPNLTIQEQFDPLIGFEVTTNNQLNLRFSYKKSRILTLSLIDYQVSEQRSTGWTFGGSFRKKGVNLPIKLPFMKGKTLDNDLSLSLDLSMQDDTQSNSRLDQANAYSTGGQKVITIQPAIDYILSNRVDMKFFFDQQKIIPYISTSAPVTNTRAGIQIRISLAPNPQ